ncbi:hypothetical protein BC939DRAFT_507031 [Gamsiella multidivaricata]|uniref:uncharacterized protein n=1 Tax=Gamsiella multidivaricata TaxID=101098 RepID=UPI002220B5B8|nr:uncharacterized protein BC939DRAFT_507031 [Gamsiella multidivaricata]KAI7817862.1 hypothetical protein BC939DRAFT_507031 [Gamsiella multidivaricata]
MDGYFPFTTFWVIFTVITAVFGFLVIGVCFWFGLRSRRRASEHSKVIGVHITPGEVISPLTTGPHLQYRPDTVLPTYTTTTIAGASLFPGEELVLVPRSALQHHSNIQVIPLPLPAQQRQYPYPQPNPSVLKNPLTNTRQTTSMEAIRESSGAYLARPDLSPQQQQQQQHSREAALREGGGDATELSEAAATNKSS